MTDYKISFVIPIYNGEKYLSRCVESILNQSVTKQIILVNDGSIDGSLNIALNYAAQYDFVSVIDSPNLGIASARNKGLEVALGEYVMFLDVDDILHEQINFAQIFICLEGLMSVLPDVIKGAFEHRFPDDPARNYIQPLITHHNDEHDAFFTPLNKFLVKLLGDWFMQVGCYLTKRRFLLENNLFFPDVKYGEDSLFNARLLSCEGSIVEMSYIFSCYYHYSNSFSNQLTKQHFVGHFQSIELLESFLQENNNEAIEGALYALLFQHLFFLYRDYFISSDEITKPFRLILEEDFYRHFFNLCPTGFQYIIDKIPKYRTLSEDKLLEFDRFYQEIHS